MRLLFSVKVGDILYFPYATGQIRKVIIENIIANNTDTLLRTDLYMFSINDIGKTIFQTEEEARKNAKEKKIRRFKEISPEKESE